MSKRPAMTGPQVNNPLHGITLERIVNRLVAHFGWERLGTRIPVRCFTSDPSVRSALKFLRKTPWARRKVEELYLRTEFPDPTPDHGEADGGEASAGRGSADMP